jgi:hypothetical protein
LNFEYKRDVQGEQIAVYRGAGERPPAAKNLFEKRFLDLQKLSKSIDMPRELIVGSIEETPMGPLPHWCI